MVVLCDIFIFFKYWSYHYTLTLSSTNLKFSDKEKKNFTLYPYGLFTVLNFTLVSLYLFIWDIDIMHIVNLLLYTANFISKQIWQMASLGPFNMLYTERNDLLLTRQIIRWTDVRNHDNALMTLLCPMSSRPTNRTEIWWRFSLSLYIIVIAL